ncbi:MAG TPA: DUF3426 domain-containing protein [Desulfomicrobiaceae bacterium]|nr:DUF3426 domain-containing protein [Desulfomicrobiaceae bacterium]
MVIQCPECGTKYKVPDDKARPEGTPVRCTKCKHVFKIFPEIPAEKSAAPAPVAEDQGPDAGAESAARPEPPAAQAQEPVLRESDSTDFGSESVGGDEQASEDKGKSRLRIVLLVVLLICAGAAAALYQYPDLPRRIMDMATGSSAPPVVRQAEQQEQQGFEKISLSSIKQYFVKNEKVGQLFVLEGKALNGSSAPLKEIMVQATLYDAAGKKVTSGRTGCGSTVSLFQLQVLDRAGLDAALQPGQTPDAADGLIRPGTEVPFMILFFDPPQQIQEFGLEVVDVRE